MAAAFAIWDSHPIDNAYAGRIQKKGENLHFSLKSVDKILAGFPPFDRAGRKPDRADMADAFWYGKCGWRSRSVGNPLNTNSPASFDNQCSSSIANLLLVSIMFRVERSIPCHPPLVNPS
jgi:hypothetical protein